MIKDKFKLGDWDFENMSKIILYTLILLISPSCDSETKHSNFEESLPESISVKAVQSEGLIKLDSKLSKKIVTDDDFVFRILDNELTFSFLVGSGATKTQTIVTNLHNKSINDTLFTFINGTNIFKVHKALENTILTEAEITSEQYRITDEIKIGVLYNVFVDRFSLKTAVDTLIVKDFENTNQFIFLFNEEQALHKIKFRTTYID